MWALLVTNCAILVLTIWYHIKQDKLEKYREEFITDALVALDENVCRLNIDIKNVMREVDLIAKGLDSLSAAINSLDKEIERIKP